jgi:hypothetical protein
VDEGFTLSDYDMAEQRHRHEEDRRRHERRMEALRRAGYSAVALSLAGALVGVSWVVWQGVRGPSASEQLEQDARVACLREGGQWVPGAYDDAANARGEGLCVVGGLVDP